MIELFLQKKECYGCTACINICPNGAITMFPDEQGFLYPQINPCLCIECELCLKVCPFHNSFHMDGNLAEPDIYGVKHKSDDVRMNSSSGGMFTAISNYMLEHGGPVYGAMFDKDFTVCHQKAGIREDCNKFRGSKYVQSDLRDVFREVKEDLMACQYVLFSGTPCQTAGLHNYLKGQVDLKKLFLCDLVCHGTPSPQIFKDYIDFLKNKFHSQIEDLTFRYKPAGWRSQAMSVWFKNGETYMSAAGGDIYYKLFLNNYILRSSCYNCKFANLHRPSDITIGDFWGIKNGPPDFEDEKGVSLILVNTRKGRTLFEAVSDRLYYRKSNIVEGMQVNLKEPSKPSPKIHEFWTDYQTHGFVYVAKKYADAGIKGKSIDFCKKTLKKTGVYNIAKNLIQRKRDSQIFE